MKYLTLLFLLFSINLNAQNTLKFNKRYVECEDKWVAFKMSEEGKYSYGFIYIDEQAGLTFNFEGDFTIDDEGKFIPEKMDSFSVKYRLEPNQVKVAIIPPSKYSELQIEEIPEWLKYYKGDTASVARLYKWGFYYNSWNECAKALTYLERAQKMDPNFQGLAFELAYAYNGLEEYDKAIEIINNALITYPKDCYLYKELSFAENHLGNLEKAAKTCKTAISFCSDKLVKSEIAYNLAYQYYKVKNTKEFKYWAKISKKWAPKGSTYVENLKLMEKDLK